jgi:hypothetical protein
MSPADYKVDSVEGGCRNLRDLIDIICHVRFELSTGDVDNRIDSLLWIARDLSEGLVECHQRETVQKVREARR